MSDQTAAAPEGPLLSEGYKRWALFLLVVVYTSNFIDRTILNILGQPIKAELKLTDFQLGVLVGIAFAAFYVVLGVAFGWLSDRVKRKSVITVSLALWSAFTAACGYAQNFNQLFLMRLGVGFGEAGCSPAAQSMLSDYYPPQKRSTALAIYSLGIPLGTLFGALFAGWIAQTWGWRRAFLVVGLPGLLLALVCQLVLKEPARGTYDPVPATGTKAPGLGAVFKRLFGNASFPHMTFGASLGSMAGYGIAAFAVPYLLRGGFGLDLKTAARDYGVVGGLSAALGVVLGGFFTDWSGKHFKTAYALIPGLGFIAAAPLYVWAFQQTDLITLGEFVIAPLVLQYFYLGPTFAVSHNLVEPRMRATATSLLFLPINLIGLGIGPPLVGWLSDQIAQRQFTHAGVFKTLCPGGSAAKGADAALAAACHAASFDGVKWAITLTAGVVYAWAGVHYLLAARSLKRDLERATA